MRCSGTTYSRRPGEGERGHHAMGFESREPPGCDPADRVCPGAFCCCKCGCGSGRVLCPPAAAGAGRVGSWGARVRVTRRVNPGPRPSSVSTSQLHAQLTTLIILAILGLTAWASVLGPAGRSPRSIMTDLDPVLSPLCWWCLGSVRCRNRLFGRWVDRSIVRKAFSVCLRDRSRAFSGRSLDRQLACSFVRLFVRSFDRSIAQLDRSIASTICSRDRSIDSSLICSIIRSHDRALSSIAQMLFPIERSLECYLRSIDRLIDRLRSPFALSLDRQPACSLECYLSSIARSPSH